MHPKMMNSRLPLSWNNNAAISESIKILFVALLDEGFSQSHLLLAKKYLERIIPHENGNQNEEKILFLSLCFIFRQSANGALTHPEADIRDFLAKHDLAIDSFERILKPLDDKLFFHSEYRCFYLKKNKELEDSFIEQVERRLARSEKKENDSLKIKHEDLLEKSETLSLSPEQEKAVEYSPMSSWFILSGGPGCGKTFTLGLMLRAWFSLEQNTSATAETVCLTAPTGRAAKRMQESIAQSVNDYPSKNKRIDQNIADLESKTLHALRFKLKKDHYALGLKLVIIDESSMVDLQLLVDCLKALHEETQIWMIGDPHQLPAVGIGSVFSTLVPTSPSHLFYKNAVHLLKNFRSTDELLKLSRGLEQREIQGLLVEKLGDYYRRVNPEEVQTWRKAIHRIFPVSELSKVAQFNASEKKSLSLVFKKIWPYFKNMAILCAYRKGLTGVEGINQYFDSKVQSNAMGLFPGKPILIKKNQNNPRLFNGDRGVCLFESSSEKFFFAFEREEGEDPLLVEPHQVGDWESAWAMTIHKSQGSEYHSVFCFIPDGREDLLTREILYTALTRAKKQFYLVARTNTIEQMVQNDVLRPSGLEHYLKNKS